MDNIENDGSSKNSTPYGAHFTSLKDTLLEYRSLDPEPSIFGYGNNLVVNSLRFQNESIEIQFLIVDQNRKPISGIDKIQFPSPLASRPYRPGRNRWHNCNASVGIGHFLNLN